jgi:hypothetical protein
MLKRNKYFINMLAFAKELIMLIDMRAERAIAKELIYIYFA